MWRLIVASGVGLLLAALLDPTFLEYSKANANKIAAFSIIFYALFMVTDPIHFLTSVNVVVIIGYSMGALGVYLIYRSRVLPKRKAWVTLFLGLMLIVFSFMFLDSLAVQRGGKN